MERVSMLYLSLLCVGGWLIVVTAEPSVSAWILTPEADRKEGGQVHMRCIARNLEPEHIVEWRTEDRTLRWGNHTITTNPRFMFETTHTGNRQVFQDFTITNLERDDTDEYVCSIRDFLGGGGYSIVASARVQPLVVYFPHGSFPRCSPDGPVVIDTGTELHLQCSSEIGNPTVTMDIFESPISSNDYTWATSVLNNTVLRTLNVIVDDAIDGVTFSCNISSVSFPGMSRSCNIGPVSVRGVTESSTGPITETPPPYATRFPTGHTLPTTSVISDSFGLQTTPQITNDPPSSNSWIAFTVAIFLFVASFLVNIILSLVILKMRHFHMHLRERDTKAPKVDPYMELQPTDDKNREYMEPAAKDTTIDQSTYYQVAEVKSPEHGYEQPGDSTNTKYEKVDVPKNSERQYQNIEAIH